MSDITASESSGASAPPAGTPGAAVFSSPGMKAIARLTIALLIAVIGYNLVTEFIIGPVVSPGGEFGKHWVGAHERLEGRSPYYGPENVNYLGFNYPMFTAIIYTPLAFFTVHTAEHIWDTIG